MHLVCFGDSICYGYGARPGEGWVAQMTRMLATLREPVAVTNAGVSGDTTEDGLRRMQWDVERHHPNAVFVQFGLNDASFWYTSVGRPLVGFRTSPTWAKSSSARSAAGRIPSFWPPTTGLRKRRTSLEPNSTAAPSGNTTKGCGLPFQG
mgnify:CR=1 FL=1